MRGDEDGENESKQTGGKIGAGNCEGDDNLGGIYCEENEGEAVSEAKHEPRVNQREKRNRKGVDYLHNKLIGLLHMPSTKKRRHK